MSENPTSRYITDVPFTVQDIHDRFTKLENLVDQLHHRYEHLEKVTRHLNPRDIQYVGGWTSPLDV